MRKTFHKVALNITPRLLDRDLEKILNCKLVITMSSGQEVFRLCKVLPCWEREVILSRPLYPVFSQENKTMN